jgi:hypothetical protein
MVKNMCNQRKEENEKEHIITRATKPKLDKKI